MKKVSKLGVAIATSLSLMCSSSVFALAGDGDSLVNLPINASTVTDKSVDVWFVRIDEAYAYSIDLVGSAPSDGVAASACNNADTTKRIYEKKMILDASGLDCGQETAATKPGDDNAAIVHLCKWTTSDLANGNYALAINPIFLGDALLVASQEVRTAVACAGDDAVGYANNTGRKADKLAGNDLKYQTFSVNAAGGAATAIPAVPVPILPAAGSTLDDPWELTFIDSSVTDNQATWYELWVYDKTNVRINTFADNPTFKHWYKNTVDSELDCTETNAQGNRLCTIEIDAASIARSPGTDADGGAVTASGDTLTWWIKGYNDKGASDWSAISGSFKAP